MIFKCHLFLQTWTPLEKERDAERMSEAMALSVASDCVVPLLAPPSLVKAEPEPTHPSSATPRPV